MYQISIHRIVIDKRISQRYLITNTIKINRLILKQIHWNENNIYTLQ